MLYQLAILEHPTPDEAGAGAQEKIIYGPINVVSRSCEENALNAKIAALATAAGALPSGWTDRMFVVGVHMRGIG